MTTFLNRPAHDQPEGAPVVDAAGVARWRICGSSSWPRTMGPATRWGKNDRYTATSIGRAGRELAAVHVDHIADRHEREERDGDGQRRSARAAAAPARHGVERVVDVDGEEAVVLEPAEQAHVAGERRPQGDRSSPALRAVDRRTRHHRDHDGRRQQEDVAPVPPAVEHEAGRDHGQLPRARVRVQQPIRREDHGEEDGEIDRREEHPSSRSPPGDGPSARRRKRSTLPRGQ